MDPSLEDIIDDLQSMSFNSTNTTTPTDTYRSASSSSETTNYTTSASSSFHHPSGDTCRDAIRCHLSTSTTSSISFSDIRFLHRLGSGDIGSVYLAELKQPINASSSLAAAVFAAKVMDKVEIAGRNKEGRARTEREILEMLEHPFLPSLYGYIESANWSCLLTEFCPGGDLHVLRQRQPFKRFPESAVRFYASEVVVALEYVHMMGIVYRDLKPENVLVRADGHIMLTDFDLSLKCDDSQSTPAQLVSSKNPLIAPRQNGYSINPPKFTATSCILPNCVAPAYSCFNPKRKRKKKLLHDNKPEVVAEPLDLRSMSFVGTHEYLAPEIVFGEGHGSPVDWWTLGIFIFELFYGVTPFRGIDHEATLTNIGARALEFPKEPAIPSAAKDLIYQLLAKDPERRLGSTMGASAIKKHPFFQGVNWALLRCTTPPFVPPKFSIDMLASDESCHDIPVDYY